jgi:hypothetical protein
LNGPFDETRYLGLLEGLEISEIRLSALENYETIGAEYYAPEYLRPFESLKNSRFKKSTLRELCTRLTDGDHGSADYAESGIAFILSEAVKEGWINRNGCRFITTKYARTLERSALKTGDVLVTKTGVYFGKSAVVPPELNGANTIAHVGILRVRKGLNPYWLSTFLNCRFGYSQLRRRGIKATRPEMKLVEFQDILVPVPSTELQQAIQQVVLQGISTLRKAAALMEQAETTLLADLGLLGWQPPENLSYERTASEAFAVERLDAEHFQPKYYAAMKALEEKGASRFILMDELLASLTNGHTPLHHDLEIGEVPFLCAEHVGDFRISFDSDNSFLNSPFGKLMVEQYSTGQINPFLGLGNLRKIPVPVFEEGFMEKIATETKTMVSEGRAAERKAKTLLDRAKRAVEIAIETGEAAALEYLRLPNQP